MSSQQEIQELERLLYLQTLTDPASRQAAVKKFGFGGFCYIYLAEHFYQQPAKFHAEIMAELEDQKNKRLEIIGFRGSAKSTIGSLAFPIYAALELPDYKFIILVGDTSTQSTLNITNIKNELEHNELIKLDYGTRSDPTAKEPNPDSTLESEEEWQAKNMLLSNGVRILARSRGQKIRGLKHRQFRPRLVVVDDPEDLKWVKSKENRDETARWLRGEVIPALDEIDGKMILIGNYLHDDGLMARAKRWGTFKTLEYPLITNDKKCAWPAKYPTKEAIDILRSNVGITSWSREYLLKVVPEEGQIIKAEEISYYDTLPVINRGMTGHGIDLAISEKATADYTAIVSGTIYYDANNGGKANVYILKNPFHKKGCGLLELAEVCVMKSKQGSYNKFFPEKVGYQQAAIEFMERQGLSVEPAVPIHDKRARLQTIAPLIKNGTILFPHSGCEDLLSEVLNFGVEAHDDLVDALGYLIIKLMENGLSLPTVHWI